ncbi:MAG: ferrous iron transport protein B [Phycisphaerae bacterium]
MSSLTAAVDRNAESRELCIAVAGNPNSGKSTLFNGLTGLRQKVGNYPGVTVERHEGRFSWAGRRVRLVDLPGTYSLAARSPDERVARDVLLGWIAGETRPDGVLIVVDASNLPRNLYLATQSWGRQKSAAACNTGPGRGDGGVDVAGALGRAGGAGRGDRRLERAGLRSAVAGQMRVARPRVPLAVGGVLDGAIAAVAEAWRGAGAPAAAVRGLAHLAWIDAAGDGDAASTGLPDVVAAVLRAEHGRLAAAGVEDPGAALVESRYRWIDALAGRVRPAATASAVESRTDRIDRIVTHRVWGTLLLAGVLMTMFLAIFSGAEPAMRAIEVGQAALQAALRRWLPAGMATDLLADGVVGGAGSVLVFLPQICVLFLFVALLEDSGYMARAAFLMDRLMSRAGLHGKSFIPLLSSCACAVPGIMATRTIESPRDRLTTILVAPLMSCSARLPVYLTVIGVLFPTGVWIKAGVILAMYVLGTATALGMAALFKRTLLAGPAPPFILELPPYHLPRPRLIVRAMWERSWLFVTRAGTTIVAVCVVLWALAYFPRGSAVAVPSAPASAAAVNADAPGVAAGAQLHQSYLGQMGRAVEPALRPLGFDWRLGVGVLASFAAREVFVSTMGVVFNVEGDETGSAALRARMRAARWESGPTAGRPLLSVATGLSLMVFYVLCCQCVSTLAVTRRETNSWRWPVFMFAYMTALAYGAALVTNQVATRLTS